MRIRLPGLWRYPRKAVVLPGPAWFWRWRRAIEIGFWILLTATNGVANSVTVIMDVHRVGLDFADWEPAVWEWSSGLVVLALVPALLAHAARRGFALGYAAQGGDPAVWRDRVLPQLRAPYTAMADRTAERAQASGRIDAEQAGAVRAALQEGSP